MVSTVGQYPASQIWAMAPVLNSQHLKPTLKAHSRRPQGLRTPLLGNQFVHPGVHLPILDVFTRVGASKEWRAKTTMTVISPESGRMLFCALTACAATGQVLESRTALGCQISAPLLAMGGGVLLSACGVIPPSAAVYDLVLSLGMPMAVAMCLLETDVTRAFTDAGSTLKAFWFGALGTIIGTLVAFKAVGGFLGPDGWKIASSLCASYIGGSINYAATAQALGLTAPSLLAAGMAADNLAMAVYFGVIMSIPTEGKEATTETFTEIQAEPEGNPTVESLALSMAAATSACMIGNWIASALPPQFSGSGLAMLAVVASAFSAIGALVTSKWGGKTSSTPTSIFAGAQSFGGALMLLFFSVVGASTQIHEALSGGWPLFALIIILIAVHLAVILSLGRWSQIPMRTLLIASNANVGGPATSAAMASARRWPSLVRPAVLVGTLGYTVGTAIGCLVGTQFLQPMLQATLLFARA
ncbi:uncharacterized protein [Physcomitrium patens]|uniref:DUF819 protein n=1 Tax=Physcomitrium patens TaxID=3218 RepID=A0A7I4D190_PHYPA|nr:uncharacterized protein LOC112279005 isoform X2 [Physcomitrium patens]|eukprot:XP_024368803.1 uncharacterized protein LOC112279005 isoform X2 [Physcomitrella patens]